MSNRILVVIIWDARTRQNGHRTCIRRNPTRRRASNAIAYALVLRPVFFFFWFPNSRRLGSDLGRFAPNRADSRRLG